MFYGAYDLKHDINFYSSDEFVNRGVDHGNPRDWDEDGRYGCMERMVQSRWVEWSPRRSRGCHNAPERVDGLEPWQTMELERKGGAE